MTAFSRKSHEDNWGSLVWEIRTINHRYLDLSLRLPDQFRHLEMKIRDLLNQNIHRGKVDAVLKFQPGAAYPSNFSINFNLVQRLMDVAQQISKQSSNVQINLVDLLSWHGVLQTKEESLDFVCQTVLDLLKSNIDEIEEVRHREGQALIHFLEESLISIRKYADLIKVRVPESLKNERTRIITRFEELKVSADKDRLEQEMLWILQKSDIAEELVRLEAHLNEVQRVLNKGGVIGRRLDFLMQELHRETNTISSKSMDAGISQSAIEIKVLIEQMREQVQNIE